MTGMETGAGTAGAGVDAERGGGAVPTFYLYGEPHRRVRERFVHAESLDDRSRAHAWTIRPHAHAELNHIFHVRAGGGEMRAEGRVLAYAAPCVILVPAGSVHGFGWKADSHGAVVTVSSAYLAQLARTDAGLAPLFAQVTVASLTAAEDGAIATTTAALTQELGWHAAGHRAAAEALLLALLVRILRAMGPAPAGPRHPPGAQAALVARFRERVEDRFRRREPIAVHAAALGTSESRLRTACAAIARQSPMQMLDARALLEAQRALLYSNQTVAQIALTMGFDDAAYFSRFFRRHVGRSPRGFRQGGSVG